MYADLIRDVTRREKLRLALETVVAPARQVDLVGAEQEAGANLQRANVAFDDEDSQELVAAVAGSIAPGASSESAVTLGQGNMFRQRLGVTIAVVDVGKHLPSAAKEQLPFSTPVLFPDRLGLFLSDGARLPSGQYPQPDGGTVTLYPFALVTPRGAAVPFRVHARADYHGRTKYSFVETLAGQELWYARVWLVFQCRFHGSVYNLALVSWLTQRSGAPYGTDKMTFNWTSRFLDCIEVEHFTRTVTIVPTVIRRTAVDAQVLHLLE